MTSGLDGFLLFVVLPTFLLFLTLMHFREKAKPEQIFLVKIEWSDGTGTRFTCNSYSIGEGSKFYKFYRKTGETRLVLRDNVRTIYIEIEGSNCEDQK